MKLQLRTYTFYERRPDFVSNHSRFKYWVLIALETGRFDFETDNCVGKAEFGSLVLVAPQSKFERYATEPISYHVMQFQMEDNESFPLKDGGFAVRETARLRDDFDQLRRFSTRFDERARSRVENLLGDILHLMWASQLDAPPAPDPLMHEAAQLMKERASEPFSMRDISDRMNLTPVAFTRRFNACHGCNPVEFLTRERLNIAKKLLLGTSLSLDQIAAQCGYASGFYFSNVWKKQTGTAPGTFRRRHRV